ncbi:MAG TPA: biopolymer transporter ExbD [Bryobacteraceae bacterium]|nr:biopolymer transporter ExbD [Bryobacteraceae bacterium]
MALQIGSGKIAAAINVTPMIDILLVLLITFMVMPTHTYGLKSEVPEPAPKDAPAVPDFEDIVLRIQKDHRIDINSQPVLMRELEGRLRALFAARPGSVLFVDGARELEFADVAAVIDTAYGAGVDRIGLITDRDHP